uniref:Uncharacterized protein n=1 Tax=Strongyloides papillosus TaxID=174720 RepID=A0A0N5CHZ7_STREA
MNHCVFFAFLLLLRTILSFPLSDTINIIDSNEKIEFESKDENLLPVNFDKNNTIHNVEKSLDIIQENIEKSLHDDKDDIDGGGEQDIISDIIIEPNSILSPITNNDSDTLTNSSLSFINVTLDDEGNSQFSNDDETSSNDIFSEVNFNNNITTSIVQTTQSSSMYTTIDTILLNVNGKRESWWTRFMAGIRCALRDCSKIHEILGLDEEKNVRGIFEGSYMKKML